MTTPISPVSTMSTSPATMPPPGAASSGDTGIGGLGEDAFLKLLVAQLKYQNPLSPTDPSTFLSQAAQFTMVEKLTKLADQASITNAGTGVLAGAALVGREVTYDDGATIGGATGVVTAVELQPGQPAMLRVGDTLITIDAVRSIGEPPPPS